MTPMTFGTMLWFVVFSSFLARTTIVLFNLFGIRTGNSGSQKIAKKLNTFSGYVEILFVACIVFPIFEELVCRGFPIMISKGTAMMLLSSFIFAILHGLKDDKGDLVLPIPQFVTGLIWWHIASHYGLRYAIIAHGLHNAVCITFAFIKIQFGIVRMYT